ncbi:MAG: DUF4388 domain-containing protein [Pseudomonadota bacterium]
MPSIGGSIEVMPVEDLAAWLANRNRNGTLVFCRGNVERSFVVRAGLVLQGASSDTREYLGQHLINFGYITEEQLEKAFATQKETQIPLGRILIMVGQLTEEHLSRALSFKVRESLLDTMEWKMGELRFDLEELGRRELDLVIPVSLAEVHSEAQSRRRIWDEMRAVFPSGDMRFEVQSRPATVTSAENYVLQLLEQGKTIGDLLLELRALEFHVYARLYDLHQRGHIAVFPPNDSEGGAMRQAMQDAMAREDYSAAFSSAQAMLEHDSHDVEAIETVGITAQHVATQVDRRTLDRGQIPRLKVDRSVTTRSEFTAKERYVLSRVDGERSLNQIMQVSPISEVEFLAIIERLLDGKLIELSGL